ncbi:IS1 family transposase [Escherichia coli]
MASISIRCPSCSATEGVVRVTAKSTAGHQRYLCSHCRKTWQRFTTPPLSPVRTRKSLIYGHEWRRMSLAVTHYGRWPQHGFLRRLKKLGPSSR